jgi:hypothetical protein
LRTRPRNLKCKAKLRARKKIDDYRLSLQQQQQPPIQVHKKQLSSLDKLSINLFIYESCPSDEKIEDVLFMQIQILNLLLLDSLANLADKAQTEHKLYEQKA